MKHVDLTSTALATLDTQPEQKSLKKNTKIKRRLQTDWVWTIPALIVGVIHSLLFVVGESPVEGQLQRDTRPTLR